jgi:hypothetical protein
MRMTGGGSDLSEKRCENDMGNELSEICCENQVQGNDPSEIYCENNFSEIRCENARCREWS